MSALLDRSVLVAALTSDELKHAQSLFRTVRHLLGMGNHHKPDLDIIRRAN